MKNGVVLFPMPVDELQILIIDCVATCLKHNSPLPKDEFSDLPELMTRKQAAKALSISLGTLDTWSREGRITKVRNGGIVRFKKSELLAAFKSLTDSKHSRPLTRLQQ
ncbi:MAG: helix-turn-helix domain-containing protein [Saprospiraceae bacterium]|nr:helix-turn-helix domain-containing protein [Saprospiraceae bacterium]